MKSNNVGLRMIVPVNIILNNEWEFVELISIDESALDKFKFLSSANHMTKITKLLNAVKIYFSFTLATC